MTNGPRLHQRLADLMAAAATGDERAFARLYDLTSAHVGNVIHRVLRAPDLAGEVMQDVYLEVWQQARRFDRQRGSVLAWMTTMAYRRAVDRVRATTSEIARDDRYARETEAPSVDQVWDDVEHHHDAWRVRQALAVLTPLQLEAVILAYFGGYSRSQQAELMSTPIGTVKTRIRDSLTRLRLALAD